MAIEVKVPKDIKEYKEKIIAGMNLKQLLCLTIAGGVNILISLIFVVWLKVRMEITTWLMILVLPHRILSLVQTKWLKF